MKKVLFLADINSTHTRKWVHGVAGLGYETGIFSLSKPLSSWYKEAGCEYLNEKNYSANDLINGNDRSKASYLRYVRPLKDVIKSWKPDIIHAHYASSYGLLASLSGFHPFILSVWGSDVFEFPKKSFIHKRILKYNLSKANVILSSSKIMRNEILKYTKKEVLTVPFGIDLNLFVKTKKQSNDTITIGIIKSFEKIYGIDLLILAFELIVKKYPNKSLRLLIVGGGSLEQSCKSLINEKGLSEVVKITGRVDYTDIVNYHNMIDIFVNPSRQESFGVSVLEASACEVPVIVTDVGGLPEVALNNKTGFVVRPESPEALADAISYFIEHPDAITEFGKRGRNFVNENYNWKESMNLISDIYARYKTT